MPIFKKLALTPIFLIFLGFTLYRLNPFLTSPSSILSLDLTVALDLIIISLLVVLSSLSFIIFAVLANDWKLILPVVIIGSILPAILVPLPSGYILAIGFLVSLVLNYALLENKLKHYLTFQPNTLFSSNVQSLSGLIVIFISITFYFSANSYIKQQGFQIPDTLIDNALKVIPMPEINQANEAKLPNIDPAQLEMLKQNPALLKQSGIDPAILDLIGQGAQGSSLTKESNNVIKATIKQQLDGIIQPYLSFIPIFLSLLFFLTLKSFESLLAIFISPLLYLTFYLFEYTGLITFTKEMREVKKMVV